MSEWSADTGHGFNAHGYLAGDADSLAAMLVAWTAGEAPDGSTGVAVRLVLQTPDGAELGHLDLPGALAHELQQALRRDIAARDAANAAEVRRQEMTRLIVAARREHQVDDLGNLVAYALADATTRVFGGAPRLTMGRPGSWEADVVQRMAAVGGLAPPAGSWVRLAKLFAAMGDAKDDGGQVVSDALGYAARELGGLQELAQASGWWSSDLWKMATPLNHEDPWEPHDG